MNTSNQVGTPRINQDISFRVAFQTDPLPVLDFLGTNEEQCSSYVHGLGEADMLRIFVEEAAALASLTLFVGMIAVWAQVFSQF